ncbi:TadE/TadG family type IV pilus assembly protein [Chelativorans sp. YIM 93263]|uniref:TadE/TadG family type IV pilus assembly protein n=1 Tax=Chelativorans sp. YIM 93263 TaxID=2906648 RepID=UPI00237831C8|nr:TadE/TadG family type IV pilus assembly protein [Chelativorans sp. YIM 93263]
MDKNRRLTFYNLIRRFLRERRGASAVEFAILAFPFLLLLFAILELCIVFAAQQLMANATDDLARQFRTGQIKPDDINETEFRTMVCSRLGMLFPGDCPELVIDLQSKDTFAEAAAIFNQEGIPASPQFDPGEALSKNVLRVYYRWPVLTDIMRERISNLGDGKTLLFTTHTWQNEPY